MFLIPPKRSFPPIVLVILLLSVQFAWTGVWLGPGTAGAKDDGGSRGRVAATDRPVDTDNDDHPHGSRVRRRHHQYQRRRLIVEGTMTKLRQYPFFVHLIGTIGLCGGTLVAHDVVLTAAHCFRKYDPKDPETFVIVGANTFLDLEGGAEIRDLIKGGIRIHPQYEFNSVNDHDLLLFKIQKVTKPDIQPIRLNFDHRIPQDEQILNVIGMGQTDGKNEESWSKYLLEMKTRVVDSEICADRWERKYYSLCDAEPPDEQLSEEERVACSNRRVDPELMICGNGQSGAFSCGSDGGGPLFMDSQPPQLVGVVSYDVPGCGAYEDLKELPSVHARISADQEWITSTLCDLTDDRNHPLCRSKNNKNVTIKKKQQPAKKKPTNPKFNNKQQQKKCASYRTKCRRDQDCCRYLQCSSQSKRCLFYNPGKRSSSSGGGGPAKNKNTGRGKAMTTTKTTTNSNVKAAGNKNCYLWIIQQCMKDCTKDWKKFNQCYQRTVFGDSKCRQASQSARTAIKSKVLDNCRNRRRNSN